MIKTAVIGFGLSARVFHLPFIAASDEFELVAISTSQAEARQYWPQAHIYADATTLLAQTDAQLIVITAPNRAHFALASAALLAGKDVLVEKPLAVTSAQALELQALAARQQRKLAVFHNRRFDDDFLAVRDLVARQTLGEIRVMHARFDRFRPQIQTRWKESAETGNGVLYDLAPHLLDQTIALFGQPNAITAHCHSLRQPDRSATHADSALDYFQLTLHYRPAAGSSQPQREVMLSSSPFNALPTPRFELQGTAGSFRSFGVDPQEQILRDAILNAIPPSTVFQSDAWRQRQQGRYGEFSAGQHISQLDFPASDYGQFYQQLAAHLSRNAAAPVPFHDAIAGLKLIELALQSQQEQCTVEHQIC
jgi:scyllo-inositol 2-dehydrogenase (NADP+)